MKDLLNFIGGEWIKSHGGESCYVLNPATGEALACTPLSPAAEVDAAVQAAAKAFPDWRATPATQRIQYLFKLKNLLEENFEELSRIITLENGKTIKDARGEMRRAVENVEVACGIPSMMLGDYAEDIARGIDEYMIRQPVGVTAIIAPFNFPGMIPFWFFPYALACGNTVLIKPSERTPLTMHRVFELLEQAGFPAGVINLVNGAAETANAILDHPGIAAVSFVGSTPVAKHVYSRASASGKRVQAQGGAKNPLIILPDADIESTVQIVTDSAFGNAGQRCLAASLLLFVDRADEIFVPLLKAAAEALVVGNGLDEKVEMGPVISDKSKTRIESLIQKGASEGGELLLDGRGVVIPDCERGFFLKPTLINGIPLDGTVARTEIFGPVLGMARVRDLDEALAVVNGGVYGNMASIFTSDGAAARRVRYEAQAGNIGINIGVAAPMAFFPFSGWKDSFFGTLHAQSHHAVEFFTQTKVVVERWKRDWSRRF